MSKDKLNLVTATEKDIIEKVPGIGEVKAPIVVKLVKEGKTPEEIAELVNLSDNGKTLFLEAVESSASDNILTSSSIDPRIKEEAVMDMLLTAEAANVENTFNFELKLENSEKHPGNKIVFHYYDFPRFGSLSSSKKRKTKVVSKEYSVSEEINVGLRLSSYKVAPKSLNVSIILLTENGSKISSYSKTVERDKTTSISLPDEKKLSNISFDLKFKEAEPNPDEDTTSEEKSLTANAAINKLLGSKVMLEVAYKKNGSKLKKNSFEFKPTIFKAVDLIDVESLENVKISIVTQQGEVLENEEWNNLNANSANDNNEFEVTLPELQSISQKVIVEEDENKGPHIWTDHKVLVIYDILNSNYDKLSTVEEEYDIALKSDDSGEKAGIASVKIEHFKHTRTSDIIFKVKSPRGEIIGELSKSREFLEKNNGDIIINVPPREIDDYLDIFTFPQRPKKTTGYVIDNLGEKKYEETQIIFYVSKKANPEMEDFYPLLTTKTNSQGYFEFTTPREDYTESYAVVGVEVSDEKDRISKIRLEEDVVIEKIRTEEDLIQEVEHKKLFYPAQIILVINKSEGVEEEDCGCGDCKELDFHKPRKVLEEFTYYSIVRTTEPQIRGLTLSEDGKMRVSDFIDLVTDFDSENENALPDSLPTNFREIEIDKDIILKYTNNRHGIKLDTLAKAISESKARELKQRIKPSPVNRAAGRRLLDANNPIDWDEDPTIYQATSLAHGHILQFKQEWVNDGYSLGDLLYSLPLAPGQKKQIVTFDWERREAATGTEILDYQENLNNSLSRDRDINEIVSGSVSQNMSGGSTANTTSSSSSGGVAGGVGGFIGGFVLGIGGGYAKSKGSSTASSNAWQSSARNSSMNSLQQLRDNTNQSASAVRSQRSTVIQTVSQGETFSVETESVANYNHCHALTIQYFEVLRHFLIQYRLASVQECLFIPLEMGTFDAKKALRWRESLSKYMLNDPYSRKLEIRRLIRSRRNPLLRGFDAIERRENNYENSDLPVGKYADSILEYVEGTLYLKFQLNRPTDEFDELGEELRNYNRWGFLGRKFLRNAIDNYFTRESNRRDRHFEREIAPRIAEEFVQHLKAEVVFEDGTTQNKDLDIDFTLLSSYKNNKRLTVSMRMTPNSNFEGVRRSDIKYVNISTTAIGDDGNYVPVESLLPEDSRVIIMSGFMGYKTDYLNSYLFRNSRINNDLTGTDGVSIYTPLNRMEERNPRKEDQELANSLLDHLNDNLEYYHHVIWSSMNPRRRFMFLDGIQVKDYSEVDKYPFGVIRSVASVVENKVIGVEGNCLIMPVSPGFRLDPNLKGKEIDLDEVYRPTTPIEPTQVSVPTKGVFAEAVMGKCNSCEKKEEDRFWRWEESPIPDNPTSIQEISTDSRRAEPLDTTPTSLPAPMVNIQNAPAAPDPSGFSALAQLLANPNFENITGLDGNQKNALQGLISSFDTTKAFGQMATGLAGQGLQAGLTMAKLDAIKKAKENGNLSDEKANELTEKALESAIENSDNGILMSNPINQLKSIDKLKKDGVLSNENADKVTSSIVDQLTTPNVSSEQQLGGLLKTTGNLLDTGSFSTVEAKTTGSDGTSTELLLASTGSDIPVPVLDKSDYAELLDNARRTKTTTSLNNRKLRKNAKDLTAAEWKQFKDTITLMIAEADQGSGINRYEDWSSLHETAAGAENNNWKVHQTMGGASFTISNFLAWHRIYLCKFEDEFIAKGGIPLPYWDWYSDSGIPSEIDLSDTELAAWNVTRDRMRMMKNMPTKESVENVWKNAINGVADWNKTQEDWEWIHNLAHIFIGGDMVRGSSPKDPIFWMHHAFIDKFWADLQAIDNSIMPSNLTEVLKPDSDMNGINFDGKTVQDVLDYKTNCNYEYSEEFSVPFTLIPSRGDEDTMIA